MGTFKVLGDLYNNLFAAQFSSLDVLVDYEVWNRIYPRLPKQYSLPDASFMDAYAKAFLAE